MLNHLKSTASIAIMATFLASGAEASDLFNGPGSTKDADVHYQAPKSWSGVYIGAHGGWAFGEHEGQAVYDGGVGPVPGIFAPGSLDIDGYLAGVTLGAQRQYGNIVLGVEIDGSWGELGGAETFDALGGAKGYHWTVESTVDGLQTARGRIGYAAGNLLVFATAGIAFAQVSMDETVTADKIQGFPKDGTVTALASSDENMFGWVAGGGVEYAFAPGWSFKAEGLYVDLGEVENRFKGTAYPGTPGAFPHTTDSYDADLDLVIVRGGVNYRF